MYILKDSCICINIYSSILSIRARSSELVPEQNCNQNFTDANIKLMRACYWGACAEALEMMQRVMQAAQDNGWLNNTIVVYTSDHGDMSLEHMQYLKNSFYEPSSRVPLIMVPFNVPGISPSQQGMPSSTLNHPPAAVVTS